jgi:hypothetical protein
LLTADFGPHILAEDGSLKIGKDLVLCHEMAIDALPRAGALQGLTVRSCWKKPSHPL